MAFTMCKEVKQRMEDITGGANDLVSFMQSVKLERDKTKKRLETLTKKLDRLETQVCKDGGASDKMIEMLNKKTCVLEKKVQDIAHD